MHKEPLSWRGPLLEGVKPPPPPAPPSLPNEDRTEEILDAWRVANAHRARLAVEVHRLEREIENAAGQTIDPMCREALLRALGGSPRPYTLKRRTLREELIYLLDHTDDREMLLLRLETALLLAWTGM